MFPLAPLLLIVVSVAGLVFGEDAARGKIQAQLQGACRESFDWSSGELQAPTVLDGTAEPE